MAFASVLFLYAFLPLFLAVYLAVPRGFRNPVALGGSLVFYAWGAPQLLLVLCGVSLVDWLLSRRIAEAAVGSRRRKLLLAGAVTLNLSILAYFKYATFVVHQLSELFGRVIPWVDVALPMGISFVVFEEISYLVDVYRGTTPPAARFSTYALFLSLFPHAIAGPIFRWKDLERQLTDREPTVDLAWSGFLRFCFGLAKKVLIANQAALVADVAFNHDAHRLPTAFAWIGLVAYTLQIYFDFSGYSDMAIGLGRLMGFDFKENFDAPYTSTSITEFWRRWHMSLSAWMRDYLYIPLGGNRTTRAKQARNLVTVFLLCGLWHGANWTFLAWGAYHGALLVVEKSSLHRRLWPRLPRVVANLVTLVLVMIGWVFFRAGTLTQAGQYLGRLFRWPHEDLLFSELAWAQLFSNRSLAFGLVGLVGCLAVAHPGFAELLAWLKGERRGGSARRQGLVYAASLVLLCWSAIALVNSKFNPFIYFRF